MDPDDEVLEFAVPTSCAGTPYRNERLDLEAGGELLEIVWRAIPLRTFADLGDEMSERGFGALQRFSVVLPSHNPFSPSPLPFRLVLIRSQHILSGPNGFEEVLPGALASERTFASSCAFKWYGHFPRISGYKN